MELTKGQKYYRKHRERELERSRKIRETPERVKYMAQYQVKNREHLNKVKKKWKDNHPEYLEWKKNWQKDYENKMKKDPEWRAKQVRKTVRWGQNNPEKKLAKDKRHLEKIGKLFSMSYFEMGMAYHSWSKVIKKKFPVCWCGLKSKRAHHLFYKSSYPLLSLNENNGIGLCIQHHNEVHGMKLCQRKVVI